MERWRSSAVVSFLRRGLDIWDRESEFWFFETSLKMEIPVTLTFRCLSRGDH